MSGSTLESAAGCTAAPAPSRGQNPEAGLADLDAVLFDLDGVLTDTASLHEVAWTETFSELFEQVAATSGEELRPEPFTGTDYRRLVDGEPRLDGVRHVLADRNITLPGGSPTDEAGLHSAWALATKKDDRFASLLAERGPQVFPSASGLLGRLRAAGIGVGVVSASRHCTAVLAATGLAPLVDVVVDGQVAAAMRLAGKPDAATYLEAARRLGVNPERAAVVEDAVAGVSAGRAGGFRLVVGVDHHRSPETLRSAGADLVVTDIGALELVGPGPLADGWHLTYRPTVDAAEAMRETLLTLGNGYVGTRGAATWATDDGVHYPGTYLAGLYNRLASEVDGRNVERESIVNAPNWLVLTFSADGGPYLGEPGVEVSGEELRLDVRAGVLRRRYQVTDPAGRRSSVTERRLVSMADAHLAAIEVEVVAENWSGNLRVRSGIDASGCADQTTEARLLSHCHLRIERSGGDDASAVWLAARTTQSDVLVAEAARTHLDGTAGEVELCRGPHDVTHEHRVLLSAGARCHVEKIVAIYTSRDRAISEPLAAACQAAAEAPGFAGLYDAHVAAWGRLWATARTEIGASGRPAGVVNLHLFHLLQVASPHVADLDCGLGARGLHGEGYEGHVFWDEAFAIRMLDLRLPATSRALLSYRDRRLPAARRLARLSGDVGARYPWQSAADGADVTPSVLYNPRSGRWMADRSAAQRHVGLAVAYQHVRHLEATGDRDFEEDAAAVVFEVARHFAHLASYDPGLGRFRIRGVMGPDEFHDGYPGSEDLGVDDNAYTNVATAWLLARALELAERFSRAGRLDLPRSLGIDEAELELFDEVSRQLHVPFHDGVVSQFAGYEHLAPIDLHAYRARYGNVGRLDLILEAEGDTVCRYQVAKQADTLMLFYLFSLTELRETFGRLGYKLSDRCVRRTIGYYSARTTHGSTLSRVVHAWVGARSDRRDSWRHLTEALAADMADTQGGTTKEGVHLGAMAGTIDILQRCYTGLETRGGTLAFDPALPAEIEHLCLSLSYRGHRLDVRVDHDEISVASAGCDAPPIRLLVAGEQLTLHPGRGIRHSLRKAAARQDGPAGTDTGRAADQGDTSAPQRRTPGARPFTTRTPPHTKKEQPMATTTDPVCGMSIEESAAAGNTTHEGTIYYFCSPACQQRFEADPAKYVSGDR
ncbi:MAG: HAD-IA family hydrolase [Acidimicrobiales bacterium]